MSRGDSYEKFWMYDKLLHNVPFDYIVTTDDHVIVRHVTMGEVDIGIVDDIVKNPDMRKYIFEKVATLEQAQKQKEISKVMDQAYKDGQTFGDFVLWMSKDAASYPDMWNMAMLFGKALGYRDLDSGVQFVQGVQEVMRSYRVSNTKSITTFGGSNVNSIES